MTATMQRSFRRLEGRHVSIALRDGSRLDDMELVSAGHGRAATLWLADGESNDHMVRADEVLDLWEVA